MIVLVLGLHGVGVLTGPLSPTGLDPPSAGFVRVQTHVHCSYIEDQKAPQ